MCNKLLQTMFSVWNVPNPAVYMAENKNIYMNPWFKSCFTCHTQSTWSIVIFLDQENVIFQYYIKCYLKSLYQSKAIHVFYLKFLTIITLHLLSDCLSSELLSLYYRDLLNGVKHMSHVFCFILWVSNTRLCLKCMSHFSYFCQVLQIVNWP